MDREHILSTIAEFDPELYDYFQEELQKQKYTLSLMPEENYSSPLSSYLEGSILTNTLTTHHDTTRPEGLEEIAVKRMNKLFNAEHSIIRTGNIAATSRVVFYSLINKGDTVLSLDGRKAQHCNSDNLDFNFISYSIDPKTQLLDLERVRELAQRHRPKLIIFSPVNYPRTIDYKYLGEIAREVGAYMWFDMCQNVGLVAAKVIPSPVPYADVITFSMHDSLRGPQCSAILCKRELGDIIDEMVITTGHFALKKNILAGIAMVLKEASMPLFKHYAEQVIKNAKALYQTLQTERIPLLCGGTDTNLVLVNLSALNISLESAYQGLLKANFIVKPTVLATEDETVSFNILRLSSLILTTRGLKESDFVAIGKMLAKALHNLDNDNILEQVRNDSVDIAIQTPIFSDEWMNHLSILNPLYSSEAVGVSHEISAEHKHDVMKKLLTFWKK